jgi:dihydroxyacetone kinase
MTTAARALLDLAPSLEPLSEADAIRRCGTELARKAPSTGGTLIAFALMAAAKAPVELGASAIARAAAYLGAAADSVALRGQVAPGDRTMLDALRPVADAVRAAAARGDDVATAAALATQAADAGASATASMAAKVGRAGWLAGRAAGHEDAGARLMAIMIQAAVQRLLRSGSPVARPI